MASDLHDRLQRQFDRFKLFPEAGRQGDFFLVRGDAFIAFLDARKLIEDEVLPALHGLERD
ncbi:hypothetical protein [Aurantiacibacter spongiae]|uniref:Uncharacterized protein n=1 Tax=Aurantiacibacter spongiae TaxID=2488860 RepID=A0A3N5DN26_9SPHN|nr:hypothetical protein [Aurantiacibacter spongiae]RPF70431.1 hypothetical protein EG799_01405 [Aurantiacibacter spongiae]